MKRSLFKMAMVLVYYYLCIASAFAASLIQSVALIPPGNGIGEQPLSKIAIHKTTLALRNSASIKASPLLLGLNGEDTQWVTVDLVYPEPSADDWVGVFSPAKFNSATCPPVNEPKDQTPFLCTAPIKYKYANDSSSTYTKTGKNSLKFQLINQRADFSFALFSGGLSNVFFPLSTSLILHLYFSK